MQLEKVEKLTTDDAVKIRSTVSRRIGRDPFELYYQFSGVNPDFVDDSADPFAAALLIKAMRAKETLEIVPAISPRLHFMLPRIRDIYHTWWPDTMSRVEIKTAPRSTCAYPQPRAATFFSGGVDSFYSLLKNWREGQTTGWPLTHLIFMRGVETELKFTTKGVGKSEAWVRAVAEDMEIEPIFGVTNIRDHLMTHWENYDHGSALASVALCLSPLLGNVSIPATFSYNHLVPYGSSPLTDEMFSTEGMYILHGSEVPRAEKLAAIMSWRGSLALQYLRVCWRNQGGAHNCGRCRKCVRTAIPLYVMGLLEDATAFPNKDRSHWETGIAKDNLVFIRENLEFARQHGGQPELISMLTRVVERLEVEEAIKSIEAWRPPAETLVNPYTRLSS